MRLLVVTQLVDSRHSVLGFFHKWIEMFAMHCDEVMVICLEEGEHKLPSNVRVFSLGKQYGASRSARILSFYRYITRERMHYDVVFVHMNPEYIVLGGVLWRLMRKRITLWYTHGTITYTLRVATILANAVFTASKESFRVATSKKQVVGHGIDTARFSAALHKLQTDAPRLLVVGRISPTKQQHIAVETLVQLRAKGIEATLTVVGTPLSEADAEYERSIRKLCREHCVESYIEWRGSVANEHLSDVYASSDILVHTSKTGSLDKVVLEALAAGIGVITTSKEVMQALPDAGALLVHAADDDRAALVTAVENMDTSSRTQEAAMRYIQHHHSLPSLIARITDILTQ